MRLTDRQNSLLELVKIWHGEQKRKYTNEPYYFHLLSVAEIVSDNAPDYELALEVALCHDLFEDTECQYQTLFDALINLDYSFIEAEHIANAVDDLTDRFTSKEYPQYNRKARKKFEAQRLSMISSIAQTVKYADLIDNTSSIVERDAGFAKIYLQEKEEILAVMDGGSLVLRQLCREGLKQSKAILA